MKHLIDDGELDRIKQTIKALERDFEVNGSMKLYPSTPRQPSSKKKPPKTLKHHRALKMDEIRPEQVLVTPRRAAEITTNTITQHLDKHERGLRALDDEYNDVKTKLLERFSHLLTGTGFDKTNKTIYDRAKELSIPGRR